MSRSLLHYISHPEVRIDPEVPVPRWGLSEVGRRRILVLADRPWLADIGRLVSSDETKAVETATILAERLGLEVEIRPTTGETDRSSTGFVSHERHEQLAARYFAEPEVSAEGWERAIDSQRRVVEALADLTGPPAAPDPDPDSDPNSARPAVAIVGHGGAGTLLWSHLTGTSIDQANDQPGQGHYWTWDRESATMLHGWHPIDAEHPLT